MHFCRDFASFCFVVLTWFAMDFCRLLSFFAELVLAGSLHDFPEFSALAYVSSDFLAQKSICSVFGTVKNRHARIKKALLSWKKLSLPKKLNLNCVKKWHGLSCANFREVVTEVSFLVILLLLLLLITIELCCSRHVWFGHFLCYRHQNVNSSNVEISRWGLRLHSVGRR